MSDDSISFIQPRLGGGAVASALWPRPGMAVLMTQAIATVVPANGLAERAGAAIGNFYVTDFYIGIEIKIK